MKSDLDGKETKSTPKETNSDGIGLMQRPWEEGRQPFRDDSNHILNQGNRRAKPIILSLPIQVKNIGSATALGIELTIQYWNLSIELRDKTVDGMRTPFAIQLDENLGRIQRPVVLINIENGLEPPEIQTLLAFERTEWQDRMIVQPNLEAPKE